MHTLAHRFPFLALFALTLAACDNDKKASPTLPSYTLNFYSQGGSVVAPVTVESGKLATPPDDPTRTAGPNGEQYSFQGWYDNLSGGAKFDFATTPIVASRTLYAQWTATQPPNTQQPGGPYTVAFDSQDGSVVATYTVESGKLATPPADPTQSAGPNGEQYSFQGWYDNLSGGAKFNFATTPITTPITLYAYWTVTQQSSRIASHTLTFNSQGGSAVAAATVERGKLATPPADPTLQGFAFGGWHTDKTAPTPFGFSNTPITASITLYAHWARGYKVTFETYGGTYVAPIVAEQGKAIPVALRPPDPKKTNGVFDSPLEGWYTDAGFQHRFDFTAPITAPITLYTKYDNTIYLISTEAQLREVNKNLSGHYRLLNAITLKPDDWTPIGTGANSPFTGRFEGRGYAIRNMTIKTVRGSFGLKANVGLFGNVGSGGAVEAVGVENVDIRGGRDVGGLVGFNNGTVSGYVVGGQVLGNVLGSDVGGLVGANNQGAVAVGYTNVKVNTLAENVGGLVGFNSGTVVGYAVGEVSGVRKVGGLVGYTFSHNVAGYARGTVVNPDFGNSANPNSGTRTYGLLVGSYNQVPSGYHSGKPGESDVSHIAPGHTGLDGGAITVSMTTTRNDFTHLITGPLPTRWIFTPNHWPSINFGVAVDQSAVTVP